MIVEKITEIMQKIDEIDQIDKATGTILYHAFGIGVNLIHHQVNNPDVEVNKLEISEQIQLVTDTLGIDLKLLVSEIINNEYNTNEISSKEVDEASLAFIVADEEVDDYETFIEENKIKENLDFLKTQL